MNLELRNAGKDCWPLPRSAVVGRHLSKAQKAQETLPKNSEIFQKDNKKDFYRKSGKNGETEPRIFKENEYEFGTQELRKRRTQEKNRLFNKITGRYEAQVKHGA